MNSLINHAEQRIPTQNLPGEWHIASVIMHVRPEALAEVETWLADRAGVEIHARSEQGKLVVVMEAPDTQAVLDLIDDAADRADVFNAALVYHEVIPAEEEDA